MTCHRKNCENHDTFQWFRLKIDAFSIVKPVALWVHETVTYSLHWSPIRLLLIEFFSPKSPLGKVIDECRTLDIPQKTGRKVERSRFSIPYNDPISLLQNHVRLLNIVSEFWLSCSCFHDIIYIKINWLEGNMKIIHWSNETAYIKSEVGLGIRNNKLVAQ